MSGKPSTPVTLSVGRQVRLSSACTGSAVVGSARPPSAPQAQAAAAAPRFHHQWRPDVLRVEPETPRDVVDALRARGHVVEVEPHWSAAELIVIDPATGLHWGGSDTRTDGAAIGFRP